jgi:hypothetical protein
MPPGADVEGARLVWLYWIPSYGPVSWISPDIQERRRDIRGTFLGVSIAQDASDCIRHAVGPSDAKVARIMGGA